MFRLSRPLLLTLLLTILGPTAALAQGAAEIRSLSLSDGRVLTGVVLESAADGMLLQIPQGTTLVPYASLAQISVIDQPTYDGQAPARIAVAPTQGEGEDAQRLAAQLDRWISDAAALLPKSAVTSGRTWVDGLGDQGFALLACRGELSCVRALSGDLDADYLLLPHIIPSAAGFDLSLTSVVRTTGSVVGSASAALILAPTAGALTLDGPGSARAVLGAIFAALSITPGIDVAATAAEAFPPVAAEPEPIVEADPPDTSGDAGEGDGGADAGDETDPTPDAGDGTASDGTDTGEPVVATPPDDPKAGTTFDPRRGRAVALGFLPVPGLASASIRDVPGFVVSLLGTVGLSWAAISVAGFTARTEQSFWTPTLIIPYGLNVLFNEISVAIGWKRLYGNTSTPKVARRRGPTLSATIAPLLSEHRGRQRARGAGLFVAGTF